MIKERFMEFHKGLKPHSLFLLLIVVISGIHFSFLFTSNAPYPPSDNAEAMKGWQQHDNIFFYTPRLINIYQEIKEGNYYPLWNKYLDSGQPLMADPEINIFDFPIMFMLLGINPYLSMNISILLHVLIAGIAMYFLVYIITKSKDAAFIAAICYANGGYYVWDLIAGAYAFMQAMSFVPIVLICLYFFIFRNNYLLYAVLSALAITLVGLCSPTVLVYLSVFIALFLIYFLVLSKNKKEMLKKYAIFALIVLPLVFGLLAFKVLPSKEFLDITNRGQGGLSYAEARGGRALLDFALIDPWLSVKNNRQMFRDVYIGIIPFILLLFNLPKIKKTWRLFLFISLGIFFFISLGGHVYDFFYKFYPMISSMRRPQRFLTIGFFIATILVAFGYLEAYNKFGRRFNAFLSNKFKKLKFNWFLALVAVLLIINLNTSSLGLNYVDMKEEISKNDVMNYISNQSGVHRIQSWEMRGLEYGMEDFTQPLKIEHLYGYVSVWSIDYFNIFMGASFQNPAKMWGMLNTKYVISMTPLNESGFKFLNKFKECSSCNPLKAAGPYLYENERYLPRAYITNNAILVYGKNKQNAQQLVYSLILSKEFEPKNAVIISTDSDADLSDKNFLSKFKGIFLTEAPPSESVLQYYKNNGGLIFPDIFAGKTSISGEEIGGFFDLLNKNSDYYPIEDYSEYKPLNADSIKISLKEPKTGFLVLSEQYSYYPGWKIESDGKDLRILKASNILSSIYLNGQKDLTINYAPKSFKYGSMITIISIIITIVLLILFLRRKG